MSPHTERLLHKRSTGTTCLCGETGIHTNNLMSSACSLDGEDVEELPPAGIENTFRQMMILDHVGDTQVLNDNSMIAFSIAFGRLEMIVTPLAMDLQVGLGNVAGGLTPAVAALLAHSQLALLAPEHLLRRAIEAGIVNRIPFAIGQEDIQSNINANIRMVALGGAMVVLGFYLTGDTGVPVPIGSIHEIDHLGLALYRTMQFDLEEVTELLWNDEMLLVLMQIAVFAILPQLNGVPPIRLLEAGKAHSRQAQFFCGKKAFERLGEPVSKALDRCSRDMLTPTLFERGLQGILAGECAILLILSLQQSKHLVVEVPRLRETGHEQPGLLPIRIQAVLKHLHASILMGS